MAPFDRDKTLDQPSYTTGISFLTLPGELRNRIYEQVIKDHLGIHSKVVTPILPCCRVSSNQPPGMMMKAIVSSCRMGQVSRTVREEFLSMLWRRFDFYYNSCIFCISEESPEVPSEVEDLQSIAPMLRRHVTSLTFFIHLDQDVPSRFSNLANILLAVEFKGTLTIDGQKSRVIAVEEGLELIRLTGAYERDTIAAVKSIEKQIDRRRLKRSEPWTRVITFDITNSQNTGS